MNDDKDDKKKNPFEDFLERFFGFRKGSPFEDFFKDFNELFERLNRDVERFGGEFPEDFEKKHHTYGFNLYIGPDGKPKIQEFGNIHPGPGSAIKKEDYEPSTSTYSEEGKIKVVADLPGARKEDININASEREVEIEAEGQDRHYHKVVKLSNKIIPDSGKARYENGVLELTFDAKEEKRKKNIEIE